MNDTPSSPSRRVALAIDALRHGWPVALEGGPVLLPAETGFGAGIAARTMLISAARAVTLKLANQREAAVPEAPVLIRAADPFDLPTARALADPALDLRYPMKGPFRAEPASAIRGTVSPGAEASTRSYSDSASALRPCCPRSTARLNRIEG